MKHPLTFIHLKEFVTHEGKLISMKSLITVHGTQFVECYESTNRYPAEVLQEVINQ